MNMDNLEQEIALGKAEIQEGKYQEATVRLQQVLGAEPGNPEAIHGLAVISAQTDNLENALALANKAAQLDDTNIDFASTLSLVRFMVGDKRGAVEAILKVTNDNPGDRELHISLAEMAAAAGLPEVAYESLEQYLKDAGTDEKVLDMLGRLFDNVLANVPPPQSSN